ncbi:aldehyde dehydrogenase family protein [Neorhizobium sp. P12A]|uniref:aldehyde dehydrogenase family protein n=1 Tax=Rhizobium/Agrobacterium group TaxID=227290 RepID=UPI001043A068|nr:MULTISPECIES: aldehyde dehydrogenase family protein [Rhizobium/Agrobacterium group]KAA0697287.1 aldehyde dehydrogenase family protein [Neorhizobium sp. P12A]TCR85841.1 acyl-CoA reductase-like NAD-dependent aldehyde dehydrogenase [Rhizobium sp. BK376]
MSLTIKVHQAFDRAVIAEVPADDAAALERKLDIAAKAFSDRDAWMPAHQRMAILRKASELLQNNRDRFAVMIAREGGKPLTDAIIEVTRAIDGLVNAADELRNFGGKEIPMGLTAASVNRLAFTTKEPIGVVAAISAFNHPLNLIIHQIAPAIAVGCPVIIKPAATTPISCIEAVKLLREAGLDERWCQTFITDDNALAEALATDRRVAFLSFIGSARVGWYLKSKLPPGTRCALEHGGAAPVIVDRSAKLDAVVGPVVKGGYYHAGQVCVSVQRIFVHEELVAEFTERLASKVAALHVGDPTLKETEVGPLILPRETERVANWIKEATDAGTVQLGGGRLSETTLLPSVLVNPPADAKVSQLEVFGPLTCVYGYRELDEAIRIANSLPYAFQASVFSSDIAVALKAAKHLDAAAVLVNDHTAFRTDWMPFAGRRQSGYGVGGIPWTMEEMADDKMVVFNGVG